MFDEVRPLAQRFRGFLPVVVDVETGGFDARHNALLEVAAVTLDMDEDGHLHLHQTIAHNVRPHPDTRCDQAALDFTGIDPHDPERKALSESEALNSVFKAIRRHVRDSDCNRAIVVAHNAHFDLGFINAAVNRNEMKRNPFHPFSCMDTATLAGLAFGQTVLAKACQAADIPFNSKEAHSASYDAERTAMLFCTIVNRWRELGGWPLPEAPET